MMDDIQQENQQPELSALDLIAQEAASEEAVAEAAANPEPAPLVDPATAWAQIPAMFGGLISMALPELAPAYSQKNCMQWGSAMALVAEKHGWDASETMTKWAPEIALVMATLPLAVPTFQAIKSKRKKAAVEKPALAEQHNEMVDPGKMALDKDGLPVGGNFVKPE